MDQELIKKVKAKLRKITKKSHHIILQVHQTLRQYKSTGTGKEALEHYLKSDPRELRTVYYYRGKVYDFTDMEIVRYSCANRHKEWHEVGRFHRNNYIPPKYKK